MGRKKSDTLKQKRKQNKNKSGSSSSLPHLSLPTGTNAPRLEPKLFQNYKNGEKKKPRKKKKGGPKFSDQLGVKVSWSTWQWRQGQEKFHKETISRAKSYVGRQIREHQHNLEKLNSIFDPQKMKDLQRAFKQKMIDRDNLGMLKRLSMIATEKTFITKTNDPYERRYINKLRRDKARMIQNTKQYELNMMNFDNQLMLKRLRKTRTSLQSRKGLKKDYKRSRVMRKAMSKVFDPKFQKEALIERGLYNPVVRNTPIKEKKKRRKRRNANSLYETPPVFPPKETYVNKQNQYFDDMGNAVNPTNFAEINGPNPFTPDSQIGYSLNPITPDSQMLDGGYLMNSVVTPTDENQFAMAGARTPDISQLHNQPMMYDQNGPLTPDSRTAGMTPPLIGMTPPYSANNSVVGKPPLAPLSRGSVATTPLSIGGASMPKSAASSAFTNSGLAEPKNLLMKQRGMRIAEVGVLVSAYRGPKEALIYEVTDPASGVITYYDIPPNVIYEIGQEFPALLETQQGGRIAKLATLLDIKHYFNNPKNITAKMYWWHKQQHPGQ